MSDPAVIGFPRDHAATDPRIILTPAVAEHLVHNGYRLLTERGIGSAVGISDAELAAYGVEFTTTDAVWECPLLLRYKAFKPSEIRALVAGQGIGAVLHAEGDPELIEALVDARVSAWSYELLRERGRYPLMQAGGRITGIQAVLQGALHLQAPSGGRGVLLGRVPGAQPVRVVVIGHGNVGGAAVETAHALGAHVTALARTHRGRRRFLASAPAGVLCRVNSPAVLRQELADADLVIGAILISTYDTPAMITEDDLSVMRPGSVIVDATCGYGAGYLPTAGPVQTPGEPPRRVADVVHVKIDVLPSLVPVTATQAYARNAAPYLRRLADVALRHIGDPPIDSALVADNGELVHPVVRQHAAHYAIVQ
jgi:alanine dehydrogenase